jgi:hypothetical protein
MLREKILLQISKLQIEISSSVQNVPGLVSFQKSHYPYVHTYCTTTVSKFVLKYRYQLGRWITPTFVLTNLHMYWTSPAEMLNFCRTADPSNR